MKDILSINIKIGDRVYPLQINRKEEEKYREAAKLLDEMVNKYRIHYNSNDTQDIIAMAAFQYVLKYIDADKKERKNSFIEELKNMNDDLSDFLSEKAG